MTPGSWSSVPVRFRGAAACASVAAALSVIISCGPPGTVTTDPIVTRIRNDVDTKTGLLTKKVECPGRVKGQKGTTFKCTAFVEDLTIPFDVTLDNSSGTKATFKPAKAVLLVQKMDQNIATEFKNQKGADVQSVDCGNAKIMVRDVNDTFDCTLSSGGQSYPGHVTVKDLDGNVRFSVTVPK